MIDIYNDHRAKIVSPRWHASLLYSDMAKAVQGTHRVQSDAMIGLTHPDNDLHEHVLLWSDFKELFTACSAEGCQFRIAFLSYMSHVQHMHNAININSHHMCSLHTMVL